MSLPLAALPQVTSHNKLDVFYPPRFPTNHATGIRATALTLEEVSIVSAKLREGARERNMVWGVGTRERRELRTLITDN